METTIKQRLVSVLMVAVIVGGIAGCAKDDPYRSSGRVIDDRMVKSRVKSALDNSPAYKFPHVDVNTYNGVVQLNGFVHREEQKAVAAELARNTEGVKEVINNISIIPQDAYGGTIDTKAGVRGTGANTRGTTTNTNYPSTQRNPNQ